MNSLRMLVVVLSLVMLGVVSVEGADSGVVSVTYTCTQGLSMTLSPGTWAIGSMAEGATSSTFNSANQGYFTVTNTANGTSYMDISAGIAGGMSIGGAAGVNTVRIGHGQATGAGPYTEAGSYTALTGSDANLATITSGNTYKFDLQLLAPTSTTLGGVQQTITVTVTAKTS